MRKFTTIIMLLAVVGSANADFVLKVKSGEGPRIRAVPKEFSINGQAIAFTEDDGEVTVYTSDFLIDRKFRIHTEEYESGGFIEVATVTITGMNFVPEKENGSKNYSAYPEWEASSQEEMINKLGSSYSAFTDPMGNPGCYYNYSTFKFENIFGKQYPTSWYALIDGMVYSIYTYDYFYSLAYDEDSAVWTRISENIGTYSHGWMDDMTIWYEGIRISEEHAPVYLTQNFFNNDDKLEYVTSEYGPAYYSYNTPDIQVNGDGTVTLSRYVYLNHESTYVVYNEDGIRLGTIVEPNCFFVISGKHYVSTKDNGYVFLYSIDTSDGGDFDLVEKVRAKDEHRLGAERGIVTVDIDAEQAGGEVVVSTTDGKVMASKKVGIGQTRVNDQPLPAGIYVVSLLKDGRVVESEKYLVQ